MPVGTAGTVKAVPQDVLESWARRSFSATPITLYLRPGHEAIRRMGGLHKFISWPRAMLTDSGGFQVFSLSHCAR
jgi:queuine tRNA-ribosyltransferase